MCYSSFMTTSQTPEERREAQIEYLTTAAAEIPVAEEMINGRWIYHFDVTADGLRDAFLTHFDEHEPKVALAIREGIHESVPEEALRYGVKRKSAHRMLCDIQAGGDCDCDGIDLFQINSPEAREAMKNDGKWENDIPMTPRELQHVELLRKAGCSCHLPLLGYRLSVGPRCRLCNTQAQEQR